MSDSESVYRSGVQRWHERDLDRAIELLEEARAASPGPEADPWWFAVERALAQIALELDDLDGAEKYLRRLPDTLIGQAQTLAVRGRRELLLGNPDAAAAEAAVAVARVAEDRSDDVGSLMNGAIVLYWCAEMLVEAGFAQAASQVAAEARSRAERAGVEDALIESALTIVEATAARLGGSAQEAAALLAAVDTSASPDFGVLVARERARLSLDDGDRKAADDFYRSAAEGCAGIRHVALGRLIGEERRFGPPGLRSDDAPIETWASRRMSEILSAHRPYAVVVRWIVDPVSDRHLRFEDQVTELLTARPDLGGIDGTGSDGEIWELFLDGEDPDALWAAIRPLVEAAQPTPGSSISLRRKGDTEERALR